MDRSKCLLIVAGRPSRSAELHLALKERHRCVELSLEKFRQGSVVAIDGIVIDIDLANQAAIDLLKEGLANVDRNKTFVVCLINALRSADILGAQTLDVDDVITCHRPRQNLASDHEGVTALPSSLTKAGLRTVERLLERFRGRANEPAAVKLALDAGTQAMASIFDLGQSGKAPKIEKLREQSVQIVDALSEFGLARWVEKVRLHHSATYQHCLIVTGVAAAFGQSLGFSEKDIERMTLGGMLHDIGKAMVPIEILEKPGPLTDDEWAIMRTHPSIGRDILSRTGGFDAEMADVVAHHHEYLDGSGYPDKLSGWEISDIVRVMTIADIFGALIERRSYKPEMSADQAYEILCSMKSKLDMPLVRAFRETAVSFPFPDYKIAV